MSDNFIEKEVDMQEIVDAIDEGNCIVILGPELCLMKKDTVYEQESIQDHISNKIVNCIPNVTTVPYLPEEGFFYCTSDTDYQNILKKIRSFYKNLQPHEMYSELWRIPFRLYISLSPDHLMKSAFPEDYPCQFDYHFAEGNTADIETKKNIKPPSSYFPLVYNLMGSWEEKDSIVFTYEALFTYLTTIFSDNTARSHISDSLKRSNVILFLGFSFDKWYLKLLFFLIKKKWITDNDQYRKIKKQAILFCRSVPSTAELNPVLNDGENNTDPEAGELKYSPQDTVLKYYKSEFSFSFCPLDQFEFVHKLFMACEQKKILRGQSKNKAKLLEELKILVNTKKVGEAVTLLQHLSDEDTKKDIESIKSDYMGLTNEYAKSVMRPDDYEVNRNKIFIRIQNILSSIKTG